MDASPTVVQFAKKLASNEKQVRKKSLKRLKGWLTARSSTTEALGKADFLKLWKGLHYSMWMADKSLVQEQLANGVAEIIHVFEGSVPLAMRFIEQYFVTECREWNLLDSLRMDKFMMFMRRMIREALKYFGRLNWPAEGVKQLADVLSAEVASPKIDASTPKSLLYHVADLYIEEIFHVAGLEEIPQVDCSVMLILLQPFVNLLVWGKHLDVAKYCKKAVFIELVSKYKRLTQSKEDVEVIVDFDQIADHLFNISTVEEGGTNLKLVYDVVKVYRNAATSGESPAQNNQIPAVEKSVSDEESTEVVTVPSSAPSEVKKSRKRKRNSPESVKTTPPTDGKKELPVENGTSSPPLPMAVTPGSSKNSAGCSGTPGSAPKKVKFGLHLNEAQSTNEQAPLSNTPYTQPEMTGADVDADRSTGCAPSDVTQVSHDASEMESVPVVSEGDGTCPALTQLCLLPVESVQPTEVAARTSFLMPARIRGKKQRYVGCADTEEQLLAKPGGLQSNAVVDLSVDSGDSEMSNGQKSDDESTIQSSVSSKDGSKSITLSLSDEGEEEKAAAPDVIDLSKDDPSAEQIATAKNDDIQVVFTQPSLPKQSKHVRPHNLEVQDTVKLIQGMWLNDNHINLAQALLYQEFPDTLGLENCCLGIPHASTEFTKWPAGAPFVQICNAGGNHWVTITTMGAPPGYVYVYDSLRRSVSSDMQRLIRLLVHIRSIQGIVFPRFQKQRNGSDCGLFAIAATVSLLYGEKPEEKAFIPRVMRKHLMQCFLQKHVDRFPETSGPVRYLEEKRYKVVNKGVFG